MLENIPCDVTCTYWLSWNDGIGLSLKEGLLWDGGIGLS